MRFNPERVQANVRRATTDDLMDRVTAFRAGLEPAALPIIMEELRSRGITPEAIVDHEAQRQTAVADKTGVARYCARCRKPAVTREWGWHRLFGKVPIFVRPLYLCEDHRQPQTEGPDVQG
ncbi:MAG TPA: hypothetical protein VHR66_16030 [Gemmataceae bacterium]|jgi:hypothetical protein|nr:hypothetical protein [Gemmataceae bacterium]